MKTKSLLTIIVLGALCAIGHAQDIDSIAPVVVKTVPEAGTKNVPPGEYIVHVTFSKEMTDQSWSWSSAWKDSAPEIIGKPNYSADHRVCTVGVKLEPGKTYGWWLNSEKFHNFKDTQGHPAIPYLLVFRTADK